MAPHGPRSQPSNSRSIVMGYASPSWAPRATWAAR
jgi:hypothetical protein